MDESTCTALGGTWDGAQCVVTAPPLCANPLGLPVLSESAMFTLGALVTALWVSAWVWRSIRRAL